MRIGQYFTAETPYGFYAIGGIAILLIVIILLSIAFRPLPKKIADRIRKKDYIRQDTFLHQAFRQERS